MKPCLCRTCSIAREEEDGVLSCRVTPNEDCKVEAGDCVMCKTTLTCFFYSKEKRTYWNKLARDSERMGE